MRSAATTSSRLGAGLCGVYAFLFACLVLLVFVGRFGVNVPYWDEWVALSFYAKLQAGTLSWADLWLPQNEHRILVPRLAFLALYQLFGEWNVVTHMAFSALLVGITVGVLGYTLARLAVSPLVIAAIAVLLTSPTQWDNILFGYQIQCFGMNFAVVGAVCAVALDDALRWRTIGLCIACCLVATGSIASGVGLWAVIGALLVVRAVLVKGSVRALLADRAVLARLAVFALVAFAVIGFFLIGYHPISNRDLRATSVGMLFGWMARVLSCPVLDETITAPKVVLSALLWLNVAGATALYIRRRARAAYRGRLVLFAGIGLMLFVNAAITGYGRGATPYVPSRYTTLLLLNSILWLVAAADVLRWSQRRAPRVARAALIVVSASVVGLLIVHGDRYLDGLSIMRRQGPDRAAAKEALTFYLRDHGPKLPFTGFAVFPPHVFNQGDFGRPELTATLPPDMRPALTALPVLTRGGAWAADGAYEGTADTAPLVHWGTWHPAGPTATGRIRVGPIAISEPVLRVPIAGYVGATHSAILIEDAAHPRDRIAYAGPPPGDTWVDWNADVSRFVGRQVVIEGIDADQQLPGWLAFGRPRPMTRSLLVFDLALSHAGTGLIAVVLTALGLLVTLAHARRLPPSRRLRAFALATAVLLGAEALIATTWLLRESSASHQVSPPTRTVPRPRQ